MFFRFLIFLSSLLNYLFRYYCYLIENIMYVSFKQSLSLCLQIYLNSNYFKLWFSVALFGKCLVRSETCSFINHNFRKHFISELIFKHYKKFQIRLSVNMPLQIRMLLKMSHLDPYPNKMKIQSHLVQNHLYQRVKFYFVSLIWTMSPFPKSIN